MSLELSSLGLLRLICGQTDSTQYRRRRRVLKLDPSSASVQKSLDIIGLDRGQYATLFVRIFDATFPRLSVTAAVPKSAEKRTVVVHCQPRHRR